MKNLNGEPPERRERRAQKVKWLATNSGKFEKNLPVLDKRVELLAAISENQIVVVTGETGSGKTTQLPQLCLELGRGSFGFIGHTQPRRISAKAVAQRLADELAVELGQEVGYHVRFDNKYCRDTIIKVMTDGILLSEIRTDKLLDKYDTLIIDEAHERNLNTDFILGYLAKILDQRPDLKVIITSATIDSEKFAKHFNAPVVSVSGRSYKVDIQYRSMHLDAGGNDFLEENIVNWTSGNSASSDFDLPSAVLAAVKELLGYARGDILVFLPGERDIKDTASLLKASNLKNTETIPLYSRLSAAEQHKIFAPHQSIRIILATNIAETSLTIPNIKYVVDSGLARISRFNHRTKVQRLPIEPISRASADQRAGRCGRTSEGLCIRLYTREDYENRPQYTEPEILRTNLASVLLHMAAIGLGDVSDFPFLDQPDNRAIQEGYSTLLELGALKEEGGEIIITKMGLSLAEFPMDPRMARILFEAIKLNCLHQIIVIVAFLSIQDPRELPSGEEEIAKGYHGRFSDEKSDFISILKLWDYLIQLQTDLTSNQFRKRCKTEFLNVLRVREWQDVVSQINQICRMMRFSTNSRHEPSYEEIHEAVLTGFLSHIGSYDARRRMYKGVKNTSFYLSRSSFIASKKPKWLVAANIVETLKVFAYTAAEVDLTWLLKIAKDQIKYQYSDYWWDSERGESMMYEKAMLYGLILFENRLLGLRQVNFDMARAEFIEKALCEQGWETRIDVIQDIRGMFSSDIEHYDMKTVRVEQDRLMAFYDKLIPHHIASGSQFKAWYKKNPTGHKEYLLTGIKQFIKENNTDLEKDGFPSYYTANGFRFPVVYPNDSDNFIDGIGVQIPLAQLFKVNDNIFSYSIPAYRVEVVRNIIKAFPKEKRRLLASIDDAVRDTLVFVNKFLDKNQSSPDEHIIDVVTQYVSKKYNIDISENIELTVPSYMKFIYLLYDEGIFLGSGDSVEELQHRFTPDLRKAFSKDIINYIDTSETTTWMWEVIPQTIPGKLGTIYPAITPSHFGVKIVATESKDSQTSIMAYGIRKLLSYEINISAQAINKSLTKTSKKFLKLLDYTEQELADEVKAALIDYSIADYGREVFSQEDYRYLLQKTVDFIIINYKDFFSDITKIFHRYLDLSERVGNLQNSVSKKLIPLILDIEVSLTGLLHKGFILCSGYPDIHNLLRYLDALGKRVELFSADPSKDAQRFSVVHETYTEYLSVMSVFCNRDRLIWPPCQPYPAQKAAAGSKASDLLNSLRAGHGGGGDMSSFAEGASGKCGELLPYQQVVLSHDFEMKMLHTYGRGILTRPMSDLWQIRFLIEEFKVSVWAQELGTAQKVSKERIGKRLDALTASNFS